MKKETKTMLQVEKEELRKLIAEVKATVAGLIHLPAEQQVAFGTVGIWSGRTSINQ